MGRKNEVLIYDTIQVNLENMLSEKSQHNRTHTWLHIYEALQQVDLWRQRIEWGWGIASNCLMDTEFLFGLMTRKWIMVMVAQHWIHFSSVQSIQSLSRVRLFATPWIAACQASVSITNSRSSLRLTSIESVMPSGYFILCHPLFLLHPIPPSIGVFSSESTLRIRWPKYWSFSLSISPSNEHPGLISFRMDWLDLLAVQGTLRSLLQHHSSKASILWCSAFFTVQLSHPYMTTGKTIALTRRTFVGKIMSLLFNMLSRLVITFLPRSKRLLISLHHSFIWQTEVEDQHGITQVPPLRELFFLTQGLNPGPPYRR